MKSFLIDLDYIYTKQLNMTVKTKSVSKRLTRSAATNDNRIHITPRITGWAIRKEGNIVASKIVGTQKRAIEIARVWVNCGKASKIVVHSKNGKFREAR